MNEPNNPSQIPDDNFYKSASQRISPHLLPYVLAIGAKEGKEEIKGSPSDWLASITEKNTAEDFEMWLSRNKGVDFFQPPNQ